MAKKRKASRTVQASVRPQADRFDPEETFNDSEDEFFAGREKILLNEEPAAKRRRRLEDQELALQPSDEEVYEQTNSEPEDEDEALTDAEDEAIWGTSKADYYNADVLETEADALEEEQEARRLQQKQLKSMTEADFGFDESAWDDSQAKEKRTAVEKLPELQIPETATADQRITILKSRYPEFEPLTQDFLALQDTYQSLKKEIGMEQNDRATIMFRALSAYLGSVAMYLALLTSTKSGMALAPGELREHPVMTNLVRCRQLWQDAESLPVIEEETTPPAPQEIAPVPKKEKKQKKSKASLPLPTKAVSPHPDAAPMPAKRRKEKKSKKNDLQELLDASTKKPVDEDSDFGDEAPLTQEEAAEKARKKKSLRFYTSQIAQKANKRGAASRQAGGDDDLPYKERIRDKQDRLMREAENRARATANADEALDDDEGSITGQALNDDANEYYDMLVSNSKQKKTNKKTRADAYAEAARLGAQVYEEEQVGPDGKRKITYAIEKNKGLQPKRNKDVRNPRVKKRKKYDEKMKKLSSMRPVYKGGEGRGGYGGEATGIKTNVVKSIKL